MKMNEMITKLRHIGIIVDDIEKSIEIYKKLFDLKDEDIRVIPPRGTKDPEIIYAFVPIGGTELELIQPISERFKTLLNNPAVGINHYAFLVKNLEESVKVWGDKGVRLGHVTKDGILDMGRSKVAYFNPEDTDGILIELVEPRDPKDV